MKDAPPMDSIPRLRRLLLILIEQHSEMNESAHEMVARCLAGVWADCMAEGQFMAARAMLSYYARKAAEVPR